MITTTTLRNPLVIARLYVAMRNAVKLSRYTPMESPVVIRNRKGKPFLMIWHNRIEHGAGKSGFAIIDMRCHNVTDTVFKTIRNQ